MYCFVLLLPVVFYCINRTAIQLEGKSELRQGRRAFPDLELGFKKKRE